MKTLVQLTETSQPIEYDEVINTYTKGALYCIYLKNETVHKYPITKIFRVIEDYGAHGDTIECPKVCHICGLYHKLDKDCIYSTEENNTDTDKLLKSEDIV